MACNGNDFFENPENRIKIEVLKIFKKKKVLRRK